MGLDFLEMKRTPYLLHAMLGTFHVYTWARAIAQSVEFFISIHKAASSSSSTVYTKWGGVCL